MNNQNVMDMLKNKFNDYYGYTEALIETKVERIDFPKTIKEIFVLINYIRTTYYRQKAIIMRKVVHKDEADLWL